MFFISGAKEEFFDLKKNPFFTCFVLDCIPYTVYKLFIDDLLSPFIH